MYWLKMQIMVEFRLILTRSLSRCIIVDTAQFAVILNVQNLPLELTNAKIQTSSPVFNSISCDARCWHYNPFLCILH